MTLFVFIIFLYGTLLQELAPIIIVAFPLAAAIGYLITTKTSRLDPLAALTIATLLYMLVSGFLSGGITLRSLLNYEFYATDGRILFYYIPLIFSLIITLNPQKLDQVLNIFQSVSALTLLLLLLWLAGIGKEALGGPLFNGFIKHKTSAGTYFATFAVFFLIYGSLTRQKKHWLLGTIMIIPTFFAGSRQAIVAFAAVGVYLMIKGMINKERTSVLKGKKLAGIAGMLFFGLLLFPVIAPVSFERFSRTITENAFQAALVQWELPAWRPGIGFGQQLYLGEGGEWNLVGRICFYKRAVELGLKSPIVGVGYGRFNDPARGCRLIDAPGFICLYGFGENYYLEKNAHNSYLHFWSELGVVGLVLFGLIWWSVLKRLRKYGQLFKKIGMIRHVAYVQACEGLFFMLPASALLGHAYGAPQVGIPILSVMGIVIAMGRYVQKRVDIEQMINKPVLESPSHPQIVTPVAARVR